MDAEARHLAVDLARGVVREALTAGIPADQLPLLLELVDLDGVVAGGKVSTSRLRRAIADGAAIADLPGAGAAPATPPAGFTVEDGLRLIQQRTGHT